MTAKTWTGTAKAGLATVALIAVGAPVSQLLAQQPATTAAPAAAPADAAPVDQARIAKGRELFAGWSCTSCHSLADAGSSGDVGPHLDGGTLTEAFIVSRVTNGQGAMPSFGGQLTKEEIADVAYYIAHVSKK
ncbi:MAG: cytochrome c [Sphingobium sp.]|nr:cytochrome c [Sphingobium sp.]